jgi:hypothetical protein
MMRRAGGTEFVGECAIAGLAIVPEGTLRNSGAYNTRGRLGRTATTLPIDCGGTVRASRPCRIWAVHKRGQHKTVPIVAGSIIRVVLRAEMTEDREDTLEGYDPMTQ